MIIITWHLTVSWAPRLLQLCSRHATARDGLFRQASRKDKDLADQLVIMERDRPEELLEHIEHFAQSYLSWNYRILFHSFPGPDWTDMNIPPAAPSPTSFLISRGVRPQAKGISGKNGIFPVWRGTGQVALGTRVTCPSAHFVKRTLLSFLLKSVPGIKESWYQFWYPIFLWFGSVSSVSSGSGKRLRFFRGSKTKDSYS